MIDGAPGRPVKVAVLGGGVSGLAAAFELSEPRHNGRYEVSLYQLGWRLGGKCASGRNIATNGQMPANWRIQEHGPHVFFGFYDNAFALLREAYAALPPDPARAFATIEDALVPHNSLTAMERQADGTWLPWTITLPDLPGRPGEALADHGAHAAHALMSAVVRTAQRLRDATGPSLAGMTAVLDDIGLALEALLATPLGWLAEAGEALSGLIKRLHAHVRAQYPAQAMDPAIRRLVILFDLAAVTAIGVLGDGLLWPTREAVARANEIEYRDWLRRWGADQATVDCAIVRAMYDTVFAYPAGDVSQPGNVEAGSAVLTQLRLVAYRGPPVWKMRAGTGDITAGVIYQVLVQRGVTVNFFSRVDGLVPGAGGAIESVRIGVQATVKNGTYQPLFDARGVMAWPDRPDYGQLVQGADLQAQDIDLESYWTCWKPVATQTLSRANGDFDTVVLAIPIGALDAIAPQPLPASWQTMLEGARTVATQSIQVWLDKPTGWAGPAGPIVAAYDVTPVDSWIDETDVIAYENWAAPPPVGMAILCGPMPLASGSIPPPDQHDYPAKMDAQVRMAAQSFLSGSAPLWPQLTVATLFDWSALRAPSDIAGLARLDDQYWVAAINPSDRYVMTPAGNSKTRLAPEASGYSNVVLCGDWTDYGLNLGFFEGAIMSGLRAANAITDNPRPILRDLYDGS